MVYLMELWESIRDFLGTGGDVLYVVMGALFLMWVLMIERYWFLTGVFPKIKQEIVDKWNAREDTTSWYAHKIREAWISEADEKLNARILLIKTCVAICPLIGLLGTVTGMIAVFEIMAVQGTGNPRLMASGISMATIPTMAGMVAALSGMFFASRLEARVRRAKDKLIDSLPHH
ncbi:MULTISPECIES: MotA/TolQ/ExbB proton channel family protein [Pseudidiomarina]|uniref:Outer membrane transport energization protein ExbB n=4 Tax=Pseudidiomarina TaxID=2800384 RepID=A0A368V6R7_9GAMM|nr:MULTISPECIES: MotA/TolQ/ExbB proton channel family protein [Pseudidiomarina]MDT7525574.1 MotA/TolQ/ExbB proton channel family protein [Pseudidiomarina sp. GXY010]MDX1524809.1 MotA/TolQ/ExbB proton channel family protein [Pseudidiomarina maritima]PWW15975.1 outer membrane transport energization protein ExbB [Pseudidiomarina maritima]RBP93515.1 outer membrane transport energization protein ExbB [Pseudidiomarina tainanensis]RCW35975.1 outer membrane transport energization protein ExbB [Pseudid